jgi:hypothetical protein
VEQLGVAHRPVQARQQRVAFGGPVPPPKDWSSSRSSPVSRLQVAE